jgi:hypothetical protein
MDIKPSSRIYVCSISKFTSNYALSHCALTVEAGAIKAGANSSEHLVTHGVWDHRERRECRALVYNSRLFYQWPNFLQLILIPEWLHLLPRGSQFRNQDFHQWEIFMSRDTTQAGTFLFKNEWYSTLKHKKQT